MEEPIVMQFKSCKINRISSYKEYDYIEGEIVRYDIYYISYMDNRESGIILKVLNSQCPHLLSPSGYFDILISDIRDRQYYKLNYFIKFINDCGISRLVECENFITESVHHDIDFNSIAPDIKINKIHMLSNVYTYVKRFEVGYDENHHFKDLLIVLTKDDNMITDDDIVIISKNFYVEDIDYLFSRCSDGALRVEHNHTYMSEYKYLIKNEWYDDMYCHFSILFNDIKIFYYDGNNIVPYLVISESDDDFEFEEINILETEFIMKYAKEKIQIEGLETYIFSPQNAKLFLDDLSLTEKYKLSDFFIKTLRAYIEIAENHFNNQLYPAIFFIKERCVPSLCLYTDGKYIDVRYHEYWICPRCLKKTARDVLIYSEENHIFFQEGWHERCPDIFHSIVCPKCGINTNPDLLTEEEFQVSKTPKC